MEQFTLLAKNAKGAAAAELIKQSTEAQGVFVFADLLSMANIQEVSVKYSGGTHLRLSCSLAS